jgi:small subunit ribosomal protein S16
MPVKIRLTRMGKKKQPSYRVVVVDSRKPRDGAYIEQIGRYDPRQQPSLIEIDNEKALDWLGKGAQPTDRVRKLLEISGAWTRFRVLKGDIHTVGDTPPAPEPKPAAKRSKAKPAAAVPEEPVVEEMVVEETVVEETVVEEPVAEGTVVEEPVVEETVVEETVAEETVAEEPAAEEPTPEEVNDDER